MANRIHNRVSSLAQRVLAMEPVPEAPRTILVIDDEERFEEKVMMWESEVLRRRNRGSVKALLEGVSLLWSQHINAPLSYQHAN